MKRLVFLKMLLALLLATPLLSSAAEEGFRIDPSPNDPRDLVSLQSGARTFVNYCQGCHGLQYLRYNRLEALGLSESEIRDNLMFYADKVGDAMKTPMSAKEGKAWFGVAPPDLSLIGRSRGADWLYTYLRSFYRDPSTTTGWNNAIFPNVAMPHALWMLQGERSLEAEQVKEPEGGVRTEYHWKQLTPGALNDVQYDALVRDLVNFLVYASEPAAATRKQVGIVVLFVLGVLFIFAYLLKKEYWKDVK